jgi:hypothetical protein
VEGVGIEGGLFVDGNFTAKASDTHLQSRHVLYMQPAVEDTPSFDFHPMRRKEAQTMPRNDGCC